MIIVTSSVCLYDSVHYEDLRSSHAALNEVIVWLESKASYPGGTGTSLLSPKKASDNGRSIHKISFADHAYDDDVTVCQLVERTKVAASTVLTDRELLIVKQQALLAELEKQLNDAHARDLGSQVQGAHSSYCSCFHSYSYPCSSYTS